jgi:hypothetical protein
MFCGDAGSKASNARPYCAKALQYPKGIHVIFNPKAYANSDNLKQ